MKKTVSSEQQSILEFLLSAFHEIILFLSTPIAAFVDKSVRLSEFLVEKTNIAKYITIFLFILFLIALILYFYRP
jgi:hypothetical protein